MVPARRLLVRHRFGVHGFVKKKLDAAGLPHKKFFGFLDYQVTQPIDYQQRAGERSCAAAKRQARHQLRVAAWQCVAGAELTTSSEVTDCARLSFGTERAGA